MEKLYKSQLQLDYFSPSYLRLEKDFYSYCSLDIPLPFIIDRLLLSMAMNQRNYFRVNKEKSKDGRDHYFYFKVRMSEEGDLIRIFEYQEVTDFPKA